MNKITVTAQKELKTIYVNLAWGEGTRMAKWAMNDIFEVVELSGGKLYEVSKHRMETRFCFGYDNDNDSYENARNNEDQAHTFEAFLKANTIGTERTIARLKKAISQHNQATTEGYNAYYTHIAYISGPDRIINFMYHHTGQNPSWIEGCTLASVEDLKLILAAWERKLADTVKRCTTYWKKYGASKLTTWTYARD